MGAAEIVQKTPEQNAVLIGASCKWKFLHSHFTERALFN